MQMVPSFLRREQREEGKAATAPRHSRNVLVALAGNEMDEELMRTACYMAKNGKGHVIAITVVEVPRTLPLDAVVEGNLAEQVLDRAIRVAQDVNVEIEAEVVQAREAGSAIVDEANDRQCRLILMGINPRTRFGQFDLGRTVPYVLEHANGRVWVMRGDK